MSRRGICIISVICAFAGASGFVASHLQAAGIPATGALTYSGMLEDANGVPLGGTHKIQVNLWNTATPGAAPLCTAMSAAVALTSGRFSLPLETCASVAQANNALWIEVVVDGASLGTTKIGAVPYAIEAGHASAADTATTALRVTTADSSTNSNHATTADTATSAVTAGSLSASAIRMEMNCTTISSLGVDCTCRANEIAISGGTFTGSQGNSINASQFGPSVGGSPQTWRVSCVDPSGNRVTCATPFAVCLAVK